MAEETQKDEKLAAEEAAKEAQVAEENAEFEESADELDADLAEAGEELVEAKQQLESAQDQVIRAQAELQNVRRRAERDVENAHKFALERFSGDLLPVLDNLERTLEAVGDEDESSKTFVEGVELTLKHFLEVLKKFNVAQLDPNGEPFNPEFHQAMSMVENPDCEPNSVMAVMQKGYTLNGRLLRPAMVVVTKAAPTQGVDETV